MCYEPIIVYCSTFYKNKYIAKCTVWQICTVCLALKAFILSDQGLLWLNPNLGQLTKQTYKKSNTSGNSLRSCQYYSHLFLLSIVSLRAFKKSFQWAKNESLSMKSWKQYLRCKEIKPPVNECQQYEDSKRRKKMHDWNVYIRSEIFLL